MRKSVKRMMGAGVLGGAAYAAWRAWNARVPPRSPGLEGSSAPFPFPPVPRDATRVAAPAAAPSPEPAPAWVAPDGDGGCPPTHPIKAKLASGIYHVPGGANYARTKPDRCYVDEGAALADGLRASKA
jgi:hypothetical protein